MKLVILVKMLPNLFCKELRNKRFEGISDKESQLTHVLRRACYPHVQGCLGRYNVWKSVSITCFDFIGLNVWTTLRDIETHIFKDCHRVTNTIPIPEPFFYSIKR